MPPTVDWDVYFTFAPQVVQDWVTKDNKDIIMNEVGIQNKRFQDEYIIAARLHQQDVHLPRKQKWQGCNQLSLHSSPPCQLWSHSLLQSTVCVCDERTLRQECSRTHWKGASHTQSIIHHSFLSLSVVFHLNVILFPPSLLLTTTIPMELDVLMRSPFFLMHREEFTSMHDSPLRTIDRPLESEWREGQDYSWSLPIQKDDGSDD